MDFTIGIISDTHGLLRPEALRALAHVDHIIHCGDIGDPEIITALRSIAPVKAIKGNVDTGGVGHRICRNRVRAASPGGCSTFCTISTRLRSIP
ncbi:putative phosphoesterase [Bradyrhizobium sp. GM22.5]